MPRPESVRLPVQPLMDISGATESRTAHNGQRNPITALALMTGFARRQVHRWVLEGGIPFYSADAAALACGFHPAEVWSEWSAAAYEQGILDEAVLEAEERAHKIRAELVRGYTQVERANDRRHLRLVGA